MPILKNFLARFKRKVNSSQPRKMFTRSPIPRRKGKEIIIYPGGSQNPQDRIFVYEAQNGKIKHGKDRRTIPDRRLGN